MFSSACVGFGGIDHIPRSHLNARALNKNNSRRSANGKQLPIPHGFVCMPRLSTRR